MSGNNIEIEDAQVVREEDQKEGRRGFSMNPKKLQKIFAVAILMIMVVAFILAVWIKSSQKTSSIAANKTGKETISEVGDPKRCPYLDKILSPIHEQQESDHYVHTSGPGAAVMFNHDTQEMYESEEHDSDDEDYE